MLANYSDPGAKVIYEKENSLKEAIRIRVYTSEVGKLDGTEPMHWADGRFTLINIDLILKTERLGKDLEAYIGLLRNQIPRPYKRASNSKPPPPLLTTNNAQPRLPHFRKNCLRPQPGRDP
jgi:hypothetical protein